MAPRADGATREGGASLRRQSTSRLVRSAAAEFVPPPALLMRREPPLARRAAERRLDVNEGSPASLGDPDEGAVVRPAGAGVGVDLHQAVDADQRRRAATAGGRSGDADGLGVAARRADEACVERNAVGVGRARERADLAKRRATSIGSSIDKYGVGQAFQAGAAIAVDLA